MFAASPESPRIFETEILDRATRIPWIAIPVFWLPVIGGLVWGGVQAGVAPSTLAGQFLTGIFVWTWVEYILHRHVFHWEPNTAWGPRLHFFLHGVHHELHQDPYRLVMPPAIGLVIASVLFGILTGTALLADAYWMTGLSFRWSLFGGLLLGYIGYDLTHYYIHHGRPKSRWFLNLRRHHLAHHHNPKYADLKFGVSNTLWDHVFRTYSSSSLAPDPSSHKVT